MSEKYYIEQGTEQDHFFIESEWHVICKVNTQLECICLGKSEAELVCRLLNEHEARKSLPKIDKDLNARIKLLEKVIESKDEILIAYRLGKKPSDKVLDLLQKFKEAE